MDDLCTACLCSGRNLYYIGETGYYDLYSQIINEIQMDALHVRVCWECRALLRRFARFAAHARNAYRLLLQSTGVGYKLRVWLLPNKTSQILSQPPNLSVNHISSTSYPQIQVKVEFDDTIDTTDNIDQIKTEKDEHCEPEMDEHCEPETFVNGLEFKMEESEKVNQTYKKKTKKKLKGNKKKKKLKSIKEPVLSDGFSDREETFKENTQELVENTLLEEKEEKEESSYICAQCGLPFSDKVAFNAHIQLEHVKLEPPKPRRPRSKEPLAEKPQCVECGKTFSSRKTYRYHLNVLHKGQNRYPCPRCGKVYQWKSNLGRHLRTHKARDDGELYCALCDKRFASVATYRQHLRVSRRHVSESEFSFVCNECGKKFVNKTRLRDHVDWEHLQKIKFRCQLCNKPFKCHTSLYVHMQNVHRNKEKKDNLCHVCGKSYQNAAKLKYHIVAMHTSETPYQCGQCAAAFGWYSSLYRHTREVHYKMKVQPKKAKKGKKLPSPLPAGLVPPAP